MNNDIRLMLKIYKTKNIDWMGSPVCTKKELTRHHIFKAVYGGASHISNYALLTKKSHQFLHLLEYKNHKKYLELNNLFKELNESLAPPTEEYYIKINKVLRKSKY